MFDSPGRLPINSWVMRYLIGFFVFVAFLGFESCQSNDALEMNPLLAVQGGSRLWIPYYGYGSGVVSLSLGDNTELGGNVTRGFVRWNFFMDATVSIGGEVWVKDGKLIK